MIEYDKIEDDGIDKALSLMEHSEEWTNDDIRLAMEDEECMQTCQDILDCKLAMQQEATLHILDVDKEWERFHERHTRRSKHYWMIVGSVIGMAASFLLIIAYSWLTGWNGFSKEAVVYFTATEESVQSVTLQTTAGLHVLSDEQLNQGDLERSGAVLIQTDSMRLEYTQPVAQIETHLLSTPRGKTFEVVLEDGSKVWLNADSRLEYPSRFVGGNRIVKLYGEAYFQIVKDEKRPFIVETDGVQTLVLGTEFNVRNYKKDHSHVTLIKGSVKVCHTASDNSVLLSPGENARLLDDGSFEIRDVDVDSYIYWRDGYFYFDNMSFADIMQEIGRWYNVNVVFENARIMDYKLRYFCKRDEGIEKAIERLQCMKKAKVHLEGNTVFIK